MRKGLIGLLFCVLMLPAALWLTLPWTAQYLLQHWLQQQGFEKPELSIQHPSWQRLRIDRLSVGQQRNGRRIRLDADNIEIRFTPLALLQGRIQELRIERARLAIEADASIRGRLDPLEQHPAPLALDTLNPSQLFRYAPSRRLVIAQLELRYSAPEQPLWLAQGNLDLEPELLQGRLQLLREQETLGYLDLSLDAELNLALSLNRENRYLLRSAHQLTFPDRDWLLRSDLLLDISLLPDWLQHLKPELELPVAEPAGQVRVNTLLRLPNPLPAQLPTLLNRIALQLDSQTRLTTAAGPGFASSELELQGSAQLESGRLSLSIGQGSRLQASAIRQANLSLEQLDLRLTQPLQIDGPWQRPAEWLHSELALTLAPKGLQLTRSLDLALQPARISVPSGQLIRAQYPVNLGLPNIHLPPNQQPPLDLSLQADLQLDREQQTVSARANINSRQLPLELTLDGQLKLDLNGRFNLQLPATSAADLHNALRPWLPATLNPLKVQQGTLSAWGSARLSPNGWSLEARPVIRQLDLTWDEHTRVSDINLTQTLHLNAGGQLRSSGQLEIDHTDSGIRIFGPRLDFDLSLPASGTPHLTLSSFSLSALDGIIAVPPLSFNPLHPVIETRIAVSALELERMLELYPQEGLYGSGVLGGALPLKINGDQLSIHNGQLISQGEGGVIRYRPTPEIMLMGQQNPGIQLALDALTDFRFNLLDLTLDYAASGDAVMRARLKGRNPDWQQGRAVDLNLNIEENLLDLLRTLRLTDSVTDAIDRRFRR